jgi:phage terminase large subunit
LQALILADCADDPVGWINDWCWTYDPRRSPSDLPFNLFPRQAEFIRWLQERVRDKEGGLAEKSRDVGFTWLCAAFAVHLWLFTPGAKTTFGSRKQDLVDRSGDPDSIFAKIRFIIDHLPSWMLPAGYVRKTHDNFMRITNPANGSSITGEGGDNMGRGGRSTLYIKDEAAFIERPQLVEAAVSANSDVVIDVSTPNGIGNPFHTKRFSGRVPVFTFHWKDDPRKDEAWYQRQLETLDPIIVAQEIDIDYAASLEGVLIPRGWVEPTWTRKHYDGERGAITIGADIAEGGKDKCAAVVREGRNILHLSEWHDPEATESAGKLIALGKEFEKRLAGNHRLYLFIDTIGVGSGVAGELRNWINDHRRGKWFLVGVKVSEASPEDKCKLLRDALWWRMRDWFRSENPAGGGIDRGLAGKLTNEISSITYRVPNGLVKVESKEDLKKRGLMSPNLGDALMHTFYAEAMKPKLTEIEEAFAKRRKERGTWMSR